MELLQSCTKTSICSSVLHCGCQIVVTAADYQWNYHSKLSWHYAITKIIIKVAIVYRQCPRFEVTIQGYWPYDISHELQTQFVFLCVALVIFQIPSKLMWCLTPHSLCLYHWHRADSVCLIYVTSVLFLSNLIIHTSNVILLCIINSLSPVRFECNFRLATCAS